MWDIHAWQIREGWAKLKALNEGNKYFGPRDFLVMGALLPTAAGQLALLGSGYCGGIESCWVVAGDADVVVAPKVLWQVKHCNKLPTGHDVEVWHCLFDDVVWLA